MENLESQIQPPSIGGFHRLFSLGALRSHSHRSQILPFFTKKGGRFVEIGARSGGKDSFTLYFERALGWKGLLIEPWPHLYHKCRKTRKKSTVLNVAVVDHWLKDSFIEVRGTPPQASIRAALRREAEERLNGKPAQPPFGRPKNEKISYVSTDLAHNILKKADFDPNFDLLVLNLNGYENHALEGFDFNHHKPHFIMIRTGLKLLSFSNMPSSYELVASSQHDERSILRLFRLSDFGSN